MTLAIAATLDFPGAQPQYKMVDVTVDTAAPELVGDPQISTGEKGERLLTLERVEEVRHASQKCKHFFEGMQPAARIIGSKDDPIPHWRAEQCFFRCSCPRKKQISIYFSIFGWKNSAEGFLTMQDHLSFLH
ncbi:MAG TPA: hypothetical protein IAC27_05530 [Candidatus Enterenecus avicola]|nr:hypothetical protein [Candidatus Enterenecus avicola]